VLLGLAERLAAFPLEHADVHLVATGSHGGGMNGARHFVTHHKLDKETTYFIHIDRIGLGSLHYTTAEGVLPVFPCAPELLRAAASAADDYGATPQCAFTWLSDALIPLAQGYKTLGITATPPDDAPQNDSPVHIDYELMTRAAHFAEAVLRRIAPICVQTQNAVELAARKLGNLCEPQQES